MTGVRFNSQGVIVGSSRTADGITHPFILNRGEMAPLPGLGGRMTEALGINQRGQIVGASTYPGSNAARAVLWDRGSARASRINARGEIVGAARVAGGAEHSFRYRHGTRHDLGTLVGRNSVAMGINDHGEIVGLSHTGEINPIAGPVARRFLVRRDRMRDLWRVVTEVS